MTYFRIASDLNNSGDLAFTTQPVDHLNARYCSFLETIDVLNEIHKN